jgi:RimJ/RimL family protein N-acetyltransferase
MFRKLFPSETVKLSGHLARLTHEERQQRFMGTLADEAVRKHCERINWCRTVVIGFFDSGVLRGSAEVHLSDNRFPLWCEVAIAVETAWQEHGVATELLRRVLVIARNRASRGLRINCFGDNQRVQHLALKFGAQFHGATGQSDADILAPAPTYWSLCEEAIDDAIGWMSFWFDSPAAGERLSPAMS